MQPPAPYGYPPAYPPPPLPAPHPRTGVAVAVALVSCFVMPIVYVVLVFELLGHRFDGGGSMVPLGVSIAFGFALWITGLVLSIRSIVVSGRLGASRAGGILALVASVLSMATAAASAAFSFVLIGGGGAHGRPLRVGGRPRTAPTRRDGDWSDDPDRALPDVSGLTADERARRAARWTRDAREEHASVAAFSRLSLDLLALGAPASLVERAHRAALDEVLHARLAFGLASAYAGDAVGPDAWPEARSGDGPERPAETLRRVALESLVDGAYGEGLAARRAAEERADDPAVRAVLDVIERDESVHAELGWDLLAHCLARDPSLAAPILDAMAGTAHRADTALERAQAAEVGERLRRLVGTAA